MPNNLPPHWSWVKLSNVYEILDNKRAPINSDERDKRISGKPIESLFPYYGATGQVGFIDDYLLDGEFVLLGEDGAPFLEKNKPKAYIVKGKIWVNNHAHILLSKNHNKFLCYYLNFLDYHPFVTGTTRLKLNQSAMRQIPIINPPLHEQKKIVEKIEELFSGLASGVASLKKAKEQLRLYRQSVLAAAFSGRLHQKDDIFLKDVIFNDKQLPAGWKWVKLGDLISPSKDRFEPLENGNKKYIGLEHIEKGTGKILGYADSNTVRSTKTVFKKGDLLYGKLRPYLNKITVAEFNGVCSTDILVFTKQDGLSNSFLKYRMLMEDFVSYAQNNMSGVQHPRINFKSLSEYELMIPAYSEQIQIVSEIEKRFSEADNLEKAIDKSLAKSELLRQSILSQAFSGKLV